MVCDPRRVDEASGFDTLRAGDGRGDDLQENQETSGYHQFQVPSKFRLLRSPKSGIETKFVGFNYSIYNRTQYVSFENCTLNAYVNPVLQVLYMLRGIRSVALEAQASAFHHSNPFSLWGELGFLFHMINLIATSSTDVPRVVTANNFQLSFRQSPEALALGKSFSLFHLSIYLSIHVILSIRILLFAPFVFLVLILFPSLICI